MWGFGGLTFGLTMRYLGLSLGMAVALGLTTVIGTMGPPIFRHDRRDCRHHQRPAHAAGHCHHLAGIVVVARAGSAKQRDLGGAASVRVAEFDLKKGILIAIFGRHVRLLAWGLDAGQPIRDLTLAAGTDPLSQGPVLCVVLAGGLTNNLVWCLIPIARNRSAGQFLGAANDGGRAPLLRNYALAALGGTLWYGQFFFYTMGESQMGKYGFSSWTLHMASIIRSSTPWGFALKEWQGTSPAPARSCGAASACWSAPR
jgi:L-rhamnose-H+ transport protein